jgi:chromosome segregation ATPase
MGNSIFNKSKNSLFQKISSIFLATILLGSVATFPPYLDNSLDDAEQNNLQHPGTKKIIELFSVFIPTLGEAEAAPNENAIKSKNLRILGLSGQLSSATLEMDLTKGELAVLAHNPSSNSKKVQEIQAKLAISMDNVIAVAEEMGNEIDDLTDLITEQSAIDQGKVNLLDDELGDLDTQTTLNEGEADDLSGLVNTLMENVNLKTDELEDNSMEILSMGAIVLPQSASDVESTLEMSDFNAIMAETQQQNDIGMELEGYDDEQTQRENDADSLSSKIEETIFDSKEITMKTSEVTGSLSNLDDEITITQNALLAQQNSLNSLTIAMLTTQQGNPNGIPFKIQDLQEKINDLQEQIFDLQGQINVLVIQVNDIQSQVNGLKTKIATIDQRTSALESNVNKLKADLKEMKEKNVFQKLAITFGILSTVVGLGVTFSCSAFDFGACGGFAVLAAALAIASATMGFLA